MGLYDAFRHLPFPTMYGENRTAVTVDVLEAGLILAFIILAISFFFILPGYKWKERLFVATRVYVSLFIGAVIVLSNFGMEWESSEITTHTQYKAFAKEEIKAHIAVKIGLRGVNITLKGDPEYQKLDHNRTTERINYNERFHWNWGQGRIGFGPFAGRVNREFREAQYKGLPYPILWIAEYFTIDGENIRWGRSYRQSGWYTHICLWLCFPLWLITNFLMCNALIYGAYLLMLTGGMMVIGDIIYATLRYGPELVIPFADATLTFHKGWCFWLSLIVGILCIILGIVILIMDSRFPAETATFFNVDILQDFEDTFVEANPDQVTANKENHNVKPDESTGIELQPHEPVPTPTTNVVPPPDNEPEEDIYGNVEVIMAYRQRTTSRFRVSRRKPKVPRAVPRGQPQQHKQNPIQETIAEDEEEEEEDMYANIPRSRPSKVRFSPKETDEVVLNIGHY